MSTLCITLARSGSKGVPGKHTRLLGNKPLIAWTIEAALKAHFADYFISTDDDEIFKIAVGYNVPVIIRPSELCQDTTPTLPALQWSVLEIEKMTGIQYDYIAEIRATSPFKTAEDIDAMVTALVNGNYDSVIGVTPVQEDLHPARLKWLDEDGLIHDFIPEPARGRRQELTPKAYVRGGTVYALRRDALFGDNARLFGHEKSFGYIVPRERSINIDDEDDWLTCEIMVGLQGGEDGSAIRL